MVPAPVAPSRRLIVRAVAALGAVAVAALKEIQSATCRTDASFAMDAVAWDPAAGLCITLHREPFSTSWVPVEFREVRVWEVAIVARYAPRARLNCPVVPL